MTNSHIKRLVAVGATGALALQLFAGAAFAAVPAATDGGSAWNYSGDGWAGFEATFTLTDNSTLAKLYLEADITNGASIEYLAATKNGSSVRGCSTQASPILAVLCEFKTVRTGDEIIVQFAVDPDDSTAPVTAQPIWSTTGFVPGGNQSHGDVWDTAGILVSEAGADANVSEGFGNRSLNTSLDELGGNGQAASLKNLPNGKYAYVNDNAGDGGDFPLVGIVVNDGEPVTFQLVIVYPKGTGTPKSFEHVSTGYDTTTYTACQKGQAKVDCFEWSNKNNTVTLYLSHNGTLRRSG